MSSFSALRSFLWSIGLILALSPFSSAANAGVPSAVRVRPVPEQITDAVPPQAIAARVVALIDRGNEAEGAAALALYRRALSTGAEYLAAGGNRDFAQDVALELGRGFFERGDVADARRAWRVAVSIKVPDVAGAAVVGDAVTDAAEKRYRAAMKKLATGYSLERTRGQIRAFVGESLSTPDGSPDLQFDQAIAALGAGDVRRARHLFDVAAEFPDFAQAYLCLGVLDVATGDRSIAIRHLLHASTMSGGPNTPDVRHYTSAEGAHAAKLLLSLTAYPG